jgi:hypothetical protein
MVAVCADPPSLMAILNRQIEAMQGVRPSPRWREKVGAAVMPL